MTLNGIRSAAALDEPLRRRVFDIVRRAKRPLSREEVADAAGISRKLAAFHLDKLQDRGLLTAHYARPPGRGGPGAGRSAKFYSAAGASVEVSIPERRYDLAGELLLEAVGSEAPGERATDAALRVAAARGSEIGARVRKDRRLGALGPERALSIALEVLAEHGFEPYRDDPGVVALGNCPFHSLADRAPDLMCGMNRAFIEGLIRGLGNDSVDALLECKPGDCCVTLRAPR